jgi:hypothetical protein
MIWEIVAEAKRDRHAGGMPSSAKQEQVANERSFTGQYLRETLKKSPVSSPAEAGVQVTKKGRRKPAPSKAEGSADQPYLLAAK